MMDLPLRYNPVQVEILIRRESGRLDSSVIPLVVVDDDFREPQGAKTYGSNSGQNVPVQTQAQIVYRFRNQRDRQLTGEGDNSDGHLTFRRDVFDGLDSPIQRGDRIVKIADFPVDLQVVEVRPTGHLGGKALLVMVFFEENKDREASITG